MKQQTNWKRLNGESIDIPIAEAVRKVMVLERNAGHELKLCIGTDSQVKGIQTEFATAIVFVRKGKGGFMFIKNETDCRKMTIKERMLTEVSKSVMLGHELSEVMKRCGVTIEIHVDINTASVFKSNAALNEAMGYILAMGFDFKAKPQAFASSCCADKAVQ